VSDPGRATWTPIARIVAALIAAAIAIGWLSRQAIANGSKPAMTITVATAPARQLLSSTRRRSAVPESGAARLGNRTGGTWALSGSMPSPRLLADGSDRGSTMHES